MAQKIASVLAFQRCLSVTDGLMDSVIIDNSGSEPKFRFKPIPVVRHGIRGVLGDANAHVKKKSDGQDKNGVSNPQITESAHTDKEASAMRVRFALRPVPLKHALFACDNKGYKDAIDRLVEALIPTESTKEVSRRYARNILNGRWLWRNRVLGEKIEVVVRWGDVVALGTGSRLTDFDAYTEDEIRLAEALHSVLSGESSMAFSVEGIVHFGVKGSFEVFPSQNYVSSKPKGFARPLYKVSPLSYNELKDAMKDADTNGDPLGFQDTITMGLAALRDQKIGNAIRVVDTWYVSGMQKAAPIPVEPNGACLGDGTFYRTGSNSAYALLSQIEGLTVRAQSSPEVFDAELAYLVAILVRGGVYGEGKGKDSTTAEPTAKGRKESPKGDTTHSLPVPAPSMEA